MLIKTFNDFNDHLLRDHKPSDYFNDLVQNHKYPKYPPFDRLLSLKDIHQSPIHHPEGNVWNHTMLVIDYAAKYKAYSSNKKVFMWGALLHDIGKFSTTKVRRGKITAYGHDKVGELMTLKFLVDITDDVTFIRAVSKLVRWHMQPLYVEKKLPFANLAAMKEETSPYEIGLLSICDRLGRIDIADNEKIKNELQRMTLFLDQCYDTVHNKKDHESIQQLINKLYLLHE